METFSGIFRLYERFSSRPEIVWVHAGSDFLTALAYTLIFVTLLFFLRRRTDLVSRRVAVLFSIFLCLAASLHLLALLAPWYRVYGLQVMFKLSAAIFASMSALLLWKRVPDVLRFPNPGEAKKMEDRLQAQQKALGQLQKAHDALALSLKEREQALAKVKKEAEDQLSKRKHAETALRETDEAVHLFPVISRAISETVDFHSALEITVRKICEATGWEYGEAWVPRPDGKILECQATWQGAARLKEFHQMSQELKFPREMGLPGRVWSSKCSEWITDLSQVSNAEFFPVQKARECGVRAVFGAPVTTDGKILAVLVFFMLRFSEKDTRLADWVGAIATHLGSVIHCKRAEEKLREAHEVLEKRIREKTEELTKINQALREEVETQRLSEESVRRSQENFQTLVNSIEGVVWEFDLRTSRFTFVSQQAERMLGYPVEAWFNETTFWEDHVHGADRETAMTFRACVAEEKKDNQYEYRMITADGHTLWLRDMVTVVIVEDEAIKLRGVMVNITDQKQTEEALNEERGFVSTVLDTASAMVIILDTEGRIVRFNRASGEISGYSSEEVSGKYFWDLFSTSQETPQIKNIFARILAGQFPTNYESAWVAKDGTQRAIAWSNTALLNKYGAVVHVIATGVDVTKRKEVEQKLKQAISDLAKSNEELDKSSRELKQANESLKKLDEMKSNFISAASHELRTPLTSLKGYVETILLEEAGPVNEVQREFLGYVKDSTDRLHRLLNELLDISKIESGQSQMQMESTVLRDLLKEEIMIFKPQANEKEISLVLETDEGLMPIYCDADKIREVMDNLISNAIKYTPRKGKVRILARNHAGGVRIDVEDTGIGIRKEDLPRIFEPFQHIEKNGIESQESTGLGLTLVKKIVEAYQGEVRVESAEGKGSVFTVLLHAGEPSGDTRQKTHWAATRE